MKCRKKNEIWMVVKPKHKIHKLAHRLNPSLFHSFFLSVYVALRFFNPMLKRFRTHQQFRTNLNYYFYCNDNNYGYYYLSHEFWILFHSIFHTVFVQHPRRNKILKYSLSLSLLCDIHLYEHFDIYLLCSSVAVVTEHFCLCFIFVFRSRRLNIFKSACVWVRAYGKPQTINHLWSHFGCRKYVVQMKWWQINDYGLMMMTTS